MPGKEEIYMRQVLLSNDLYFLLCIIASKKKISIDEALVYSIETACKSVKE